MEQASRTERRPGQGKQIALQSKGFKAQTSKATGIKPIWRGQVNEKQSKGTQNQYVRIILNWNGPVFVAAAVGVVREVSRG
jgi:hypothetical protein